MTIYAHEVRKGEIAYTDENGVTQFLRIDLKAPIMTLPGNEDKEIRIVFPKHPNEVPIIYRFNVTNDEAEQAFDWQDIDLHDESETMKAIEKKNERLEARNDSLCEDTCSLESHIDKLERRVG